MCVRPYATRRTSANSGTVDAQCVHGLCVTASVQRAVGSSEQPAAQRAAQNQQPAHAPRFGASGSAHVFAAVARTAPVSSS